MFYISASVHVTGAGACALRGCRSGRLGPNPRPPETPPDSVQGGQTPTVQTGG